MSLYLKLKKRFENWLKIRKERIKSLLFLYVLIAIFIVAISIDKMSVTQYFASFVFVGALIYLAIILNKKNSND